MNLDKYLKQRRDIIDRGLDAYLPSEKLGPETIHRAMRYSVFSGGKRIRPILVLESSGACGAGVRLALPAACALEMVHTFSLIHDDLPAMDDDDTRRGKPTLHKKFDEAVAILAGDALLTLAFEVIARYSDKRNSLQAIAELAMASGAFGMAGGQALDLEYEDKAKDERTIDLINLNKTARLFEASCKIGAITAGADKARIRAIARFGRDLGLSFQIVDDILDEGDYVKAFGIARARRKARELVGRAKRHLSIFGKRGEILNRVADHIAERTL